MVATLQKQIIAQQALLQVLQARLAAGSVKSGFAVFFVQVQKPQAEPVTLFRMGPRVQDMEHIVMGFTADASGPLQKPFRRPCRMLAMGFRHMLFTGAVAIVAVAGMYCNFQPLIEQPDQLTRDPCFKL